MVQRGKLGGLRGAVNAFSDYILTKYAASRNLCVKVRRDDNAELDIGFIGGIRDDTAILTFAGAGGNAWICVRYSQVSSALDIVIAVAVDQQKICDAGAIVALTAKYNCFEPWQSSLSLNDANGLLAVNGRMGNLSAATYVVFKDSRSTNLTGYSADYVFPIKCSAGLDDFSWTNLDNIFWWNRDGTTSTNARPAVTFADAGTDYSFGTNMIANFIVLGGNSTASRYIGNLKDMPKLIYYLNLYNMPNSEGDLSSLGNRLTYALVISYDTKLTGNLSDVSKLTYIMGLYSCSITGNLASLSQLTRELDVRYNSSIAGAYTPVGVGTPLFFYLEGTSLSPEDVDDTLIACDQPAVVKDGVMFTWTGLSRTAASDAAKLDLKTNHAWTFVPDA
jgi:hypothetical protein